MPIKPGYKTTEFWLTVIAQIVAMLKGSGVFNDPTLVDQIGALLLSVVPLAAYIFSRASTKKVV